MASKFKHEQTEKLHLKVNLTKNYVFFLPEMQPNTNNALDKRIKQAKKVIAC